MNTLKYILCSAAICSSVAVAQETYTVRGVVLNDQKEPVADAVVSALGHGMVRTESDGSFEMQNLAKWTTVRVQAKGFYTKEIHVQNDVENASVFLIPLDRRNYNQTVLNGMAENGEGVENTFGVQNVAKKDLSLGAVTLD